MSQNSLNFKTVNINNTFIKHFILLSSSKFDSIKIFLPSKGAILGFTTGSSRPVRNYKNF
jgi:hypothetical protein